MIIGNPESSSGDGIIQVEISYPFSRTNNRPVLIVRQAENPELFKNLKAEYLGIVDRSKQYRLEV